MISERIKLAEKLDSELEKSLAFFENLSPEEWGLAIYTEGTCWTPEQILAHFVTAEMGFIKLMENIIGGGQGVDESFDIDTYNERQVAKVSHIAREQLIDQFVRIRETTVSFVRAINDADMEKTGRHPFLGEAPIASMLKLIYRHNQIHLRDVRKTLANTP